MKLPGFVVGTNSYLVFGLVFETKTKYSAPWSSRIFECEWTFKYHTQSFNI